MARYRLELLAGHARAGFTSGVEPLDRYFATQIGQDMRRRVATGYVAVDAETGRVAGYYTLAAAGVPLADMPEALAKRLPRYAAIPVALLGRLAVDRAYQGQKLGAVLLWDAFSRASRSDLAVFALVVDANDNQAESFYRHHGFVPFGSAARQLLLVMPKPMA